MANNVNKTRLNLYLSSDLVERLEFCSERYGVSRSQLAVILIGQGIAGIEEAFRITGDIRKNYPINNDNIDTDA